MLQTLPGELINRILHDFCDGKVLSTLAMSCISSVGCDWIALSVIPSVCEKRLEYVTEFITRAPISKGSDISNALVWLGSVSKSPNPSDCRPPDFMRFLSENLALLDFMEWSLRDFSNLEKGHFEWPVWCGQITLESFEEQCRCRRTVRLLVSSPMQAPSFLPGAHLIHKHIPCSSFKCEPYNMVPLPPWGRLLGLEASDERLLQQIAARLTRFNEVALPSGFLGGDSLDVRIISNQQATSRYSSSRWKSPTEWMLNGPEHSLMCCWQDSHEILDDRQYIDYMIDLMKAKCRVLQYRSPSG